MTQESIDFYLKNLNMFLFDFWNDGNTEFNISIWQRDNVQSGIWFEATWKTKAGEDRHVESQRMKLLWERAIKRFLEDSKRAKLRLVETRL
jgi:hypothetical protein